jgi:hypothetical protein
LIPVEIFPTSIFQKIESKIRGFTENRFFLQNIENWAGKLTFSQFFPQLPAQKIRKTVFYNQQKNSFNFHFTKSPIFPK